MAQIQAALAFAAVLLLAFSVSGADLPDLAPLAAQIPNQIVAPPNPAVTIITGETNQGTAVASGYWYDYLYLSEQPVLDWTANPSYLTYVSGSELAPGTDHWATNHIQLPLKHSGQYYLHFLVDLNNYIAESNENNNVLSVPFSFQLTPADLSPVALAVPSAVTGPPYVGVTVAWAVTNYGPGPALERYWKDSAYLSTSSVLDASAQLLGSVYHPGQVPVGGLYWSTNTWRVPMIQSGTYYLFIRADDGNFLYEDNTNNNTIVAPIVFNAQPPDLAPVALQVPRTLTAPPYPGVTIVWGVTNSGSGTALGNLFWADCLYFSATPDPNGAALLTSLSEYGPVSPGATYWRTNYVQLPVTQSGTYYLVFTADSGDRLFEANTGNNTLAVPIDLTINPADLAPFPIQVPTVVNGPPNPAVTLAWGVTNQGIGSAVGSWRDVVAFSTSPTLDFTITTLVWNYASGPLSPGASYTWTNTVRLPVIQSGTYYIVLRTDLNNSLFETDEQNNDLIVPITFNAQAPDLAPVNLLAPAAVTAPPNPVVPIVWAVTNLGSGVALGNPYWFDQLYLSTNDSLSGGTLISSGGESGPVLPGNSYWRSNSLTLPITQSGNYYLIFKADALDDLHESNFDNNSIAIPIAFNITPPDLAPLAFQVPAAITGPPFANITVIWGGTNQGSGAVLNGWIDSLYLSSSPTFDFTATQLAQNILYGPLASGSAYRQTNTFRLPLVNSGNYYFFLRVDTYQYLLESDENNNLLVVPFAFNSSPPDLAPVALQAPPTVTAPPNPTINVTWGVTNLGLGDALGYPYWLDQFYLSTNNSTFGGTLISSCYESGPVFPGNSYWRSNSLTLPIVQSGSYYLGFRSDVDNNIHESNTNNNTLVVPITVNITPSDLAPLAVQVPSLINGPPYPSVSLIWGTTNQGVGAALGSWYDGIFVSTNPFMDPSAKWVQWASYSMPLPPSSTFLRTNIVRLPITDSGDYFLLFQSDAQNFVYESNENNNVLAVPFTFNGQPPDLAPVALNAPATLASVPYPTINVVWGVLNQGLGEALYRVDPFCVWYDQLFLSTSNSLDGGTLLKSCSETGPVPPGDTYWRTNSVQLPVTQSGLYYLVFKADVDNTILETTTSNNAIIVPITLTITPPDLAPIAFQAPPSVTAPPYPELTFVWGVTNQGTGPATAPWADELFLSTKPVLDYSATRVSGFNEYGNVGPGTAYWHTRTLNVPVTASGTYYFFFLADADDVLHDPVRSNNVAVAQVSFNIQPADLTPSALIISNVVSGPPNPKLLFSWTVTNLGSGAALRQWSDQLSVSTKPYLDWTAKIVLRAYESGPIPAAGSYQRIRSVIAPVTQSGLYYFFFETDLANSLSESNTANNVAIVPVTFHIDPPDLSPILLQAPGVVTGPLNPSTTLTYAVTNHGPGPALASDYSYNWHDVLFISTNSVLDGSATRIGEYYLWPESGPVAPGTAYWRSRTVQLPVRTSGNYYLILQVNAGDYLFESNRTNNLMSVPITLNLQSPDLAPLALVAPSLVTGPPYSLITLAWGITNQGPGQAFNSSSWYGWHDSVYLSTDTNLDWPGTFVFSNSENGPVLAGTSYWRTNIVALPTTNSGSFYLVLRADDGGNLPEADENNNLLVTPIAFQNTGLPDLAPVALLAPRVLTNQADALLTVVTAVTNRGPGPAAVLFQNAWEDRILLCKSPVPDGTEYLVSYGLETGPTPPGTSYWRTNILYLPRLQTGEYFLIFQINPYQNLAESNFTNNAIAVPLSVHLLPPDLAPFAFQAPATVDGSPRPEITLVWGVTNLGPGLTGGLAWPWYDTVYLSTNGDLSGIVGYESWWQANSVPPGGVYWQTNTMHLPVTSDGDYYLVLESDTGNNLGETNFANNVASVPIAVHIHLPDLVPIGPQVPATVLGPPNPLLNVVWAVTNQGPGTASSDYGWYDAVYLSTNSVFDNSVIQVWGEMETNLVPVHGVYWHTNAIQVPVFQSGTYYLFFAANSSEWLQESDYGNNFLGEPVTLTISPPDLAPVAWLVPDTVNGVPWPTITVVAGVTNQGVGSAPGSPGWQDGLYLSKYPFLDDYPYPPYPLITWPRTNALLPGSAYWLTNTVRLPVVDSGTWYLIFKTDASESLYESNEKNNSALATISFELSPTPNLVPLELIAPASIAGTMPVVTFAWHVANQGPGPLVGYWSDTVFLSSSPTWDFWTARPIMSASITNSLVPGTGYWQTNRVTLNSLDQGDYFFILKANSDNGLFETDPADNFLSVPVRLDLTPPPPVSVIASGLFLTNGAVQLSVYGPIGYTCTLQASTNLLDWAVISNFTIVAAPTYVVDPQAGAFQHRFYRLAMLAPPLLSITPTLTNAAVLSWPLSAVGWVLEQSPSLLGSPSWTQVSLPYQTNATHTWLSVTNSGDTSFYRLRFPRGP